MRKKKLLFLFFLLLGISFTNISFLYAAPDQCKDIIPLGFYTKVNIANSGNFTNDVKNWLSSSNFKKFIQNSGSNFGISIPIEEGVVGFDFGTNDGTYQELRNTLNAGNTSFYNQSFAENIAMQIVDESVVYAWKGCIRDNKDKSGLLESQILGENSTIFALLIRWHPALGINEVTISEKFVRGAKPESPLFDPGIKIGSQWITIPFTRDNDGEVFISINTENNLGSAREILPARSKIDPNEKIQSKTNREFCIEGDDLACFKYRYEIISSCGSMPDPTNGPAIKKFNECMDKAIRWTQRGVALMAKKEGCGIRGENSPLCHQAKIDVQRFNPDFCDEGFPGGVGRF